MPKTILMLLSGQSRKWVRFPDFLTRSTSRFASNDPLILSVVRELTQSRVEVVVVVCVYVYVGEGGYKDGAYRFAIFSRNFFLLLLHKKRGILDYLPHPKPGRVEDCEHKKDFPANVVCTIITIIIRLSSGYFFKCVLLCDLWSFTLIDRTDAE